MPMRQIRLRTTAAGPWGIGQAGSVLNAPADIAADIVAQGYGVYVDAEPAPAVDVAAEPAPIEQAVIEAPERRRGGKRK